MFLVLIGAVALLIVVYWYFWRKKTIPDGAKQVPSAPGNVFTQAFSLLTRPPWNVMEEWVLAKGPTARFSYLNTQIIVVADANMARAIFASRVSNYPKDLDSFKVFGDLLGTGLVTSGGERWRRQRALIAPPFKREMLEAVVPLSVRAARRVFQALDDARIAGTPLDIAEEFRHMTLQVIGEAVLSMSADECDATFPALYLPIVEEVNIRAWHPWRAYIPTPTLFKYNRCVRELNDFVVKLIKDRIANVHTDEHGKIKRLGVHDGDILDKVIQGATDAGEDVTQYEPVRQLRDEIKTFLLAGHETSSMMLTWALYELAQDAKSLARVRDEADRAFVANDGGKVPEQLPSADDLKTSLAFTECVLKETLRLHSVVPIVPRVTLQDDVLEGYFMPAGSQLFVHIQALHNDPTLWPNPKKFDPTRFVDVDTSKPTGHRYAFNAFVNGPRSCIGQYFSLLESKIVLALLVRNFDLELALPIEQIGEKHPFTLPYQPLHGFPVTGVPRKRNQ